MFWDETEKSNFNLTGFPDKISRNLEGFLFYLNVWTFARGLGQFWKQRDIDIFCLWKDSSVVVCFGD